MPVTKEFKTIEEQIAGLEARNLKFRSRKRAKRNLAKYNYFDIINGFETIFLKQSSPSKEFGNVYFEDFFDAYKFDMNLKKHTLFKIFDIESRMRTSISYHFAGIYCNTVEATMNYLRKEYYEEPDSSDTYLIKKFNRFDLFRQTQYYPNGKVKKKSFIDELKESKSYVGQYINPPFWVVIKSLPLGSLYFTYLFLDSTVKSLVLNDFDMEISKSDVFSQAVYILKEVRNQCAHLELITRFRLKRGRKINYFRDVTDYADLSNKELNYMDVMKIFKIFGGVADIKRSILFFYIKMCLKGRKKIADKILAKMGRKSIWAWLRL